MNLRNPAPSGGGKKRFFVLVTGLAYLGLALACLWVYYNC